MLSVRRSRALSSASSGVPGNCRKQRGIPGKPPGDTITVPVGQIGILRANAQWCTSVKKTMMEKREEMYVNLTILLPII